MIQNRESITAKLCAFARAWHSNTAADKVFDDYLAYELMGREEYDEMRRFISRSFCDKGGGDTERFLSKYFSPILLSRIHFTEKRLKKFTETQKTQYVICGAGADTFSFRNKDPNIEIFEIDHPDTQRYKLNRIKELEWSIPQNVHFVSVNFEKEKMTEKLPAAGFDKNTKAFFSILGVSYYLALPTFVETLRQIAELSAGGSALAFDYPQKSGAFPERVRALESITESLGEKMRGGYDYSEVSRALYSLGFQIDTYLTPQKIQKEYFSGRKDELKAFENVNLLSAVYTGGLSFE